MEKLLKKKIFLFLSATFYLLFVNVAHAQQVGKVPRIGFLSPFSPSATALWLQAFRQGLLDLGWVEGKNISIEYRYAEGQNDRLPDLAADLVRLKVDIIVTAVTPDALAAKNATKTIPIVMAAAGDPVVSGLVDSLARPGGNITGLSPMNPELAGKRLELLKEIVPKLSRVAVFWNPQDQMSTISWNELQPPQPGRSESSFIRSRYGAPAISTKRLKTRAGRAPALLPSCQPRCSLRI
jgi:putative tryptophan/tyrosine transport system substrate-binding protein